MKSKGELTKEKILVEATRLVNQKGFEATSINDLVTATGLKKGCLYFHFSGKDELALAILEKAKSDFDEFLDYALAGKSPGESLASFFQGILEYNENRDCEGGCIFGNTALEMGDKDEQLSKYVREVFAGWTARLEGVVDAAQVAGQVRGDLSAGTIAGHIVMAIEGGIMQMRLEKNIQPLKECLGSLKTLIGLEI
jgi:TetR/AcrR family transcriptional repressor of nem operon